MDTDTSDLSSTIQQKIKRPAALTWLCVLSFIGSGLSSTAYSFYALSYYELLDLIADGSLQLEGLEIIMGAGRKFFVMGSVLSMISLLGVSLIWRLKSVGLHFYTAAQVLLVMLYSTSIKGYQYVIFDILIAGIFILLYWRFRRIMN